MMGAGCLRCLGLSELVLSKPSCWDSWEPARLRTPTHHSLGEEGLQAGRDPCTFPAAAGLFRALLLNPHAAVCEANPALSAWLDLRLSPGPLAAGCNG